MSRFFLVLSIMLVIDTYGLCQTLTGKEQQDIIRQIRQTLDNYVKDVKSGGLTAEFKYLDSSADFFWVPPGYQSAISYDSVASVLKQNAPKFKSVENIYDSLRIIPLTKHFASYTARVSSTMTDIAGAISKTSLVETGILIRRKDGWKLLNGQTNIISK
ncbi:MAG TPA: nuclear transport factor 2 family protein [Chryseolinea sp.]|nr:nuclear transport factor 2 family protein [Chryseolinea sp.]